MIFIANFVVMAALLGLFILIKTTFAVGIGVPFCLGGLVGMTMYQVAHRLRYGCWFDPPVIAANEAPGPANRPITLRDGEKEGV